MSDNNDYKKNQRPERPPRGMMVKPQKGAFKPIFRVMRYVLKQYKAAFLGGEVDLYIDKLSSFSQMSQYTEILPMAVVNDVRIPAAVPASEIQRPTARLDRRASEPPRRITAFPDLSARAAASDVTLGRLS